MTKVEPNVVLPKVELMLFRLAWQAANRRPYPSLEEAFMEAKSTAYVAFMEACANYDSRRASFITHCWIHTWYKLKSDEMRASKRAKNLPTIPILCNDEVEGQHGVSLQKLQNVTSVNPPPYFNLEEFMKNLSDDAQEIISLLMETPHELIPATTPRVLFKRIKRYLLRKWKDEERVRDAVREIKSHIVWSLQRCD